MEEKKGTNATGYQETIIIKSFYTMLDWIMADKDQWILNNQNCLKSLFKVIEIALTGQRVCRIFYEFSMNFMIIFGLFFNINLFIITYNLIFLLNKVKNKNNIIN